MDCIFCNIVSGKIPARKIRETQRSLALLDAFPLTKGHTLVIPKTHYVKVQEINEGDKTDLCERVSVLSATIERLSSSSLIAVHNGKASRQEVQHLHVHII